MLYLTYRVKIVNLENPATQVNLHNWKNLVILIDQKKPSLLGNSGKNHIDGNKYNCSKCSSVYAQKRKHGYPGKPGACGPRGGGPRRLPGDDTKCYPGKHSEDGKPGRPGQPGKDSAPGKPGYDGNLGDENDLSNAIYLKRLSGI